MSGLRLTAAQCRRLEEPLQTTRDAGLFTHTLAVLEVTGGHPVAEIARLLRISRVAANRCVQRVIARYRVVNQPPVAPDTSVDLQHTGESDEHGHPIWETHDVIVPKDAVNAYDLVYFADDRAFKDNNQGNYFLACDPRKREQSGH